MRQKNYHVKLQEPVRKASPLYKNEDDAAID